MVKTHSIYSLQVWNVPYAVTDYMNQAVEQIAKKNNSIFSCIIEINSYLCIYLLLVLGIEPRILSILGKYSTRKLYDFTKMMYKKKEKFYLPCPFKIHSNYSA